MTKTAIIMSNFQGLHDIPDCPMRDAVMKVTRDHDVTHVIILESDRATSTLSPYSREERETVLRTLTDPSVTTITPIASPRYDADWARRLLTTEVSRLLEASPPGSLTVYAPDGREASWLKDEHPDWHIAIDGRLQDDVSTSDLPARLDEEIQNVKRVREVYGQGPHMTADAICTWKDCVLLIRRGNPPFKGLLAIPGGIVDKGEAYKDAAIRELAEETTIGGTETPLSPHRLENDFLQSGPFSFDGEDRDPRGAYHSHVFHFDFSDLPEPVHVFAADDARSAEWVPLSELHPEDLAFDHYDILCSVLGIRLVKNADLLRGREEAHQTPQHIVGSNFR